MSAFIYLVCALASLALAQRVRRISLPFALALLLLPLVLTGRALLTSSVYGPLDLAYTSEPLASVAADAGVQAVSNPSISDVYTEFFPWHDALRRSVARVEWPLWNPYELCGTPLAGAAQVAPYHPITVLGLLVPLPVFFGFAAAMMYLVAAISAFQLARELVDSEPAALFAAVAWMASTHVVFFAGTALAHAISVAPLVLLGARRVVTEPGRRSAAILTAALVLLTLSGHPETLLHVVLFGVVYVVFLIAAIRPPRLAKVFATGLLAGLAALFLCAVFLLPHLEAIAQSEEYAHRSTGYEQRASTPRLMLHIMRASFVPFLEGSSGVEDTAHEPALRHGWLPSAYAGALLFAPAIYGLARGRARERWFFAAATIFGLAAGGAAPGLVHLLGLIPGFDVAVNDRMIAFATLGISMLAACGIEVLNRRMATLAVISAILIAAAAFIPTGLSPDYVAVGATRAILPIALSAAAILLLRPRAAACVMVGLLLLQRAAETRGIQPTLPAAAFYPPFPGLELMTADEPFRFVALGLILPPALSTHYGLEDVRGFQAITHERYDNTYALWSRRQPVWFNRVDDLRSPFLSLMNVRFALIPPDAILPPGWIERAAHPGYRVVENRGVIPRAFVPAQVEQTPHDPPDWYRHVASISDFTKQSQIETGASQRAVHRNGAGSVKILSANGGQVKLRATMQSDAWLVVTNTAWKGWHAYVDGKPQPIRFANHAFMAVHVPAGEHAVTFRYRPRSFVIGGVISLTTLVLLAGWAFFRRSFSPAP